MKKFPVDSSVEMPFAHEDIEHLIALQAFKPHLFAVLSSDNPAQFVNFLETLKNAAGEFHTQCLIRYNDHWLGLDLQREADSDEISVVILDAATPFNKLAGFVFFMQQIASAYTIKFKILVAGSDSEKRMQESNRDCSTFSWEMLQWAARQEGLHTRLHNLVKNDADPIATKQQLLSKIVIEGYPLDLISAIKQSFLTIYWLAFDKMNDPEWEEFFVNSQSILFPEVEKITEKWRIEMFHYDRWTPHNVRINFCEHVMKKQLKNEQPLDEAAFIINRICVSHKKTEKELGQVLRTAIFKGLIFQVKAILNLSNVNVNEIPPSGQTALDRANVLASGPVKEEIIQLLKAKNAVSGVRGSPIYAPVVNDSKEVVVESNVANLG